MYNITISSNNIHFFRKMKKQKMSYIKENNEKNELKVEEGRTFE